MSNFKPFAPWVWQVPENFNIGVACTDAHLNTPAADNIAMIVEDDNLGTSQITFAQLSERTSRFAQLLRDLGVGAGERILIRLPNSLDYPTAFLGAMKRGAISVPTSTLLTAEEVVYLAARFRRVGTGHRQGCLGDVQGPVAGRGESAPCAAFRSG